MYGLVAGIFGLAGTFAGGWLSDNFANITGNQNWYIWVAMFSTLARLLHCPGRCRYFLVAFILRPASP
ncbi:MAG: hypothetical protein ACJAX5_001970 [Patiriisocius sp.]|jgi:hypothetical protein